MHSIMSYETLAKQLTTLTYNDYYKRLMLIARNMFKWNNLPKNLHGKWIEKYLYSDGSCVFFKDEDLGFMVARCCDNNILNCYDESTEVTPIATNYYGTSKIVNEECVVIRNNALETATDTTTQLFALRLTDITRTIDVNVKAQKTPLIVLCDQKQKLTLSNVLKKIEDNEIAIFGTKNLDIESVKALRLDAPIVFDKLQLQKHQILNEYYTFLGINNANMDKKERLVDDEVQANNEQITACANVFLKERMRACEDINKVFNLNISVELDKEKISEFVEGVA